MKNSILYLVIILLFVIGVVACSQNNVDTATKDIIFEGHFFAGFELASFEPCGSGQYPDYESEYWLVVSPDSDFEKQWFSMTSDDVPNEFSKTGMYVRFVGELSPTRTPPKGYGHLGAYTNEVRVTRLLDMSFENKCPNG